MHLPARIASSPRAWRSLLLAAGWLVVSATTAHAQNKCSATGVMAGERFAANNCAAAVFPDQRSVTLWFNESPITAQEIEAFQSSAYADSGKGGKDRTMLLVAFCPGGGQESASAGAIKSIDLGLTHAKSAMASAQWVIEAPKDFKVEKISGSVKPGGNLIGRIVGSRTSDGRPYAWDLTFDVTLPTKEAASGLSCGK
jgi:hypothetical protein